MTSGPESPADVIAAPKADWDPTHSSDAPVHHWTTTNLGEAVPGIVSPLCTALWDIRGHTTARRVAYRVGVISMAELEQRFAPQDRTLRFFYGRLTAKLEYLATIGDRMPGVSGPEILESLFNTPPGTMAYHPTRRRYPFVAVRATHTFLTIPRRLAAMCNETDAWWRRRAVETPSLDLDAAKTLFLESTERFQYAMDTHVTAMFGSFQPVFDMLERLVSRAGTGDLAVLSGTGGAEMAVVTDIWRASRREIGVEEVVANHGFHGPGEGEISSRVWRDDPSPLRRAIEHYAARPDEDDPRLGEVEKALLLEQQTAAVLAALPARRRPLARLKLKLARERIPDRGRGKRAFLQATDIGRMAARRIGELHTERGGFDEPDDAFYLTEPELTGPSLPPGARELIARRRARREACARIEFRATEWRGMPNAFVVEDDGLAAEAGGLGDSALQGVGASAGVVEGVVRVVQDPGFADVEPGEVLVAPTTDPSWCSIMFVSAALVVDLGGMLSHSAVVARELGIPCVVNAYDATKRLRTGDRVRVDGGTGVVEVLERTTQRT